MKNIFSHKVLLTYKSGYSEWVECNIIEKTNEYYNLDFGEVSFKFTLDSRLIKIENK